MKDANLLCEVGPRLEKDAITRNCEVVMKNQGYHNNQHYRISYFANFQCSTISGTLFFGVKMMFKRFRMQICYEGSTLSPKMRICKYGMQICYDRFASLTQDANLL